MQWLGRFVSRQLHRPSGRFGRVVMTRMLNQGNSPLIIASLARLELGRDTSYLDAGFGGGRALREAARIVTEAQLYGLDFSPEVVVHGQRELGDLIHAGRLTLVQADIADAPLRAALCERVSTINTIYFWPAPERAAAELMRLLAPGGRLVIGYTGDEKMARFSLLTETFTHYSPARVEALLEGAGFCGVRTDALGGRLAGDFVTVAERPD
ncbi:class I SAM-dependent methyltransferase [Pseudenhygromyxa sp. WMMC2535]|uniref:class I SAM-dependent methyltransferase n=1 Tax=Pseudenhygromyxa sp. WMMC2535 TaxID=2712867 RepID=UPI00155677F7|nr:class I SAM-dependent methyltransferase [Pseudenhygromyxa sp. WMMC2535]NVB40787.1 class I SAM-dependent methyltransferase [Pseudenhygromyxa sp. WMMC2535]